jgi:ribosomal protein S18 acetylase RimI-like enzyme
MKQLYTIATPNESQLMKLVDLKAAFDRESAWDPTEEYLNEWIEAVKGIHRKDPNLLRMAIVEDEIIGYCVSVKRLHGYDGVVMDITWKNAYIWEVYVKKEYRSSGIGSALIGEVLEYLRQIGVERVSLIVNSWNEEAENFFKELGFSLWGYQLLKRLD